MKRVIFICLLAVASLIACDKEEGPKSTVATGEITIDNKLTFNESSQSFAFEAFSIPLGKKVSVLSGQSDCITVGYNGSTAYIETSNYNNSFHLYGSYPNAATAQTEFENLLSVSISDWEEWANPVLENQIWIFKTSEKKYAKFWIKSITPGEDNYVKCTIRWTYQSDGTTEF